VYLVFEKDLSKRMEEKACKIAQQLLVPYPIVLRTPTHSSRVRGESPPLVPNDADLEPSGSKPTGSSSKGEQQETVKGVVAIPESDRRGQKDKDHKRSMSNPDDPADKDKQKPDTVGRNVKLHHGSRLIVIRGPSIDLELILGPEKRQNISVDPGHMRILVSSTSRVIRLILLY
jgi:hypothetical protein